MAARGRRTPAAPQPRSPLATVDARRPIEPRGDLCIRTLAMPADTNQNGDIFGGWLLSQMDIGGGVFASKIAKTRTVPVTLWDFAAGG